MTTAHRPTWKAAVGRASNEGGGTISTMRSVLDEAAHTKLKFRSDHPDRETIVRASLQKLQEAEDQLKKTITIPPREIIPQIEEEGRMKLLKHTEDQDIDLDLIQKKYDDRDEEFDNNNEDGGGWSDLDNSEEEDSDLENSMNEDDDVDDDSEDDEIALQAELAKIRAEREALKKKEEERVAKEQQEQLEDAARLGNPLLALSTTDVAAGRMKRKWNDDVVFRNQAKGESTGMKKRFINDTVRNDFHRRFLDKFIL